MFRLRLRHRLRQHREVVLLYLLRHYVHNLFRHLMDFEKQLRLYRQVNYQLMKNHRLNRHLHLVWLRMGFLVWNLLHHHLEQ